MDLSGRYVTDKPPLHWHIQEEIKCLNPLSDMDSLLFVIQHTVVGTLYVT